MPPNPATRLQAVPAVLLVAVAIWEIVASCQARHVPGDDDWARAAAIVRRDYRPGDLIVFAPAWADPIGRLHLGDLIPLETAGRMDAARYGRIWELSIRGAIAPDVMGIEPVEQHPGPVEVKRFDRKPVEVLADITTTPNVRVDLVEVAFEPHRCVVLLTPSARPYLAGLLVALEQVPKGPPLEAVRVFDRLLLELPEARTRPLAERDGVRFVVKDMPLGSELVAYFGIADVFTRRDERTAVTLEVEIAGVKRPPVTAPIDQWVPFRTATKPGTADVVFKVRWEGTPGEPAGSKKICLAAEARR